MSQQQDEANVSTPTTENNPSLSDDSPSSNNTGDDGLEASDAQPSPESLPSPLSELEVLWLKIMENK